MTRTLESLVAVHTHTHTRSFLINKNNKKDSNKSLKS